MKVSVISSSTIFAKSRRSCRWCVVLKIPDVHHVSATIDPVRDIEVINTELVLADLASLQKRRDRIQKQLHAGEKAAIIESAIIEKLLAHLDRGKPAITAELTPEEKAVARGFFLLTSKPTIFACNVAESDLAACSRESGDLACRGQRLRLQRHVESGSGLREPPFRH